jgi:hypothetical protein
MTYRSYINLRTSLEVLSRTWQAGRAISWFLVLIHEYYFCFPVPVLSLSTGALGTQMSTWSSHTEPPSTPPHIISTADIQMDRSEEDRETWCSCTREVLSERAGGKVAWAPEDCVLSDPQTSRTVGRGRVGGHKNRPFWNMGPMGECTSVRWAEVLVYVYMHSHMLL